MVKQIIVNNRWCGVCQDIEGNWFILHQLAAGSTKCFKFHSILHDTSINTNRQIFFVFALENEVKLVVIVFVAQFLCA
jgi:hypothetical protein